MTKVAQMDDVASWVRDHIEAFVASGENSLKNQENDPAWGKPLVGFSRGDDPIYVWFKEDIGVFYLTPHEIFTKTFTSLNTAADELAVISWVLPHAEQTKRDEERSEANREPMDAAKLQVEEKGR